jgi:hypothetical protein
MVGKVSHRWPLGDLSSLRLVLRGGQVQSSGLAEPTRDRTTFLLHSM